MAKLLVPIRHGHVTWYQPPNPPLLGIEYLSDQLLPSSGQGCLKSAIALDFLFCIIIVKGVIGF